jgi:rubrerythrin
MKFFTKREFNKTLRAVEEGKDSPLIVDSRREYLSRMGIIGATGALFYACGKSDGGSNASTSCQAELDKLKADSEKALKDVSAANSLEDVKLLNAALGLELEAIEVYTAAAGLSIWTGGNAPTYLKVAGAFLGHHQIHAAELIAKVKALGGTPVVKKTAAEYFAADGITDPSTLTLVPVLQYALVKELGASQAYAALAGTMKDPVNAGIFARLAADESAHYAIFRAAFTFLDVVPGQSAVYNAAADAALIIPGAYPENWPKS